MNHCLALCQRGEITPDTVIEKKCRDTSRLLIKHTITPSMLWSPTLNEKLTCGTLQNWVTHPSCLREILSPYSHYFRKKKMNKCILITCVDFAVTQGCFSYAVINKRHESRATWEDNPLLWSLWELVKALRHGRDRCMYCQAMSCGLM